MRSSVYTSVCSVCPFVCPSVCLSVCPSMCPSVCPSVFPSICSSVYPPCVPDKRLEEERGEIGSGPLKDFHGYLVLFGASVCLFKSPQCFGFKSRMLKSCQSCQCSLRNQRCGKCPTFGVCLGVTLSTSAVKCLRFSIATA